MMIFFAITAVVLAGLGGLFAALEAAVTTLSRADLTDVALSSRRQEATLAIAQDQDAHVNALGFIRIVAEMTAAVFVTLLFSKVFGDAWWWALLCSAAVMSAVSFALVGASPRSFGREHAPAMVRLLGGFVHGVRVVVGPVANLLVAVGRRIRPGRPQRANVFTSEDQLLSMVDEATELDVLAESDRELIHSIFDFTNRRVREVMVPRIDMVTLDRDCTVQQALELLLDRGLSRAPVVGEDSDEVDGTVHMRDLARFALENPAAATDAPVTPLIRTALFLPEVQSAEGALKQLQTEHVHIALVVDEYGGIAGLVTLEDLIEELIGDISDEFDSEVAEFEELPGGHWRVKATASIDDLAELFDLEIEEDDVDSVGGLLSKELGRIPEKGDAVTTHGLHLRAEREGRRRRVTTILVRRAPEDPSHSDGDTQND